MDKIDVASMKTKTLEITAESNASDTGVWFNIIGRSTDTNSSVKNVQLYEHVYMEDLKKFVHELNKIIAKNDENPSDRIA